MATDTYTGRRGFLRGLAAAPIALASPALAAAPDPIPGLIKAHRAAVQEMEDAREARRVIEEPLEAKGPLRGDAWFNRLETVPGLREAVNRLSNCMTAEEQAFRALLCAAVNHPEGFKQLALYACELTEEEEGYAVEGASPAYRMLAAFAGLDCWSEIDGDMHPAASLVEV